MPGIKNSLLEGCYIARNEGWCVLLNSKANPEGTIVRGNTLEDCRLGAPTCGAGIILGHKDAIVENNVFKNFTLKPGCRSLIDFSATGTSINTATTFENNRIENIAGLSSNNRILYIHSANSGGHVFRTNTMTNIGVDASGDWCNAGATLEPNDISGNLVDGAMQSPNPGCP